MNPAQIDFTSLRIFIAVARTGSISAGALQIHLTPGAVSKRIAELEQLCGAPLLFRGQTGVTLTPAGNTLLEHALRLEKSVHQIASAMDDYAKGVAGHIRVVANPSAVYQGLPERVASFNSAYPSVRVEVEERLSAEAVKAVRERRADIGVFAANVTCDDLSLTQFGMDTLVLAVPLHHPLAEKDAIHLKEAFDYSLVCQVDSFALNSVVSLTAAEEGRPTKIACITRGYGSMCRMIAAGLGVGVLPESAISSEFERSRVALVRLLDSWASRPLVIAVNNEETLPAAVKTLRGFLLE